MIPELETATARTYVFYVGEPIGTVGLWKRYDDSLDEGDQPFAEDELDDDEDEGWATETAKAGKSSLLGRLGQAIVGGLRWTGDAIAKNTLGFIYALSAFFPIIRERFWRKFAHRTLYLYHKRAGGDALGFEAINQEKGRITPVKAKPAEMCEDDERPGWSAKNREKTWAFNDFGASALRVGKVPIVPLDTDSWKATSFAEVRIAEAIDAGKTRPVYDVSGAELTAEVDIATVDGRAGGAGSAVADGGQPEITNIRERTFEPRASPIFKDMLVDMGSDDYDGKAISFWKSKELWLESTTTDEMRRQEQRGFLAGRANDDWKRWALKIILIGAALGLGGLMGPELVTAVFGGGGGGGGGSVIPFMLGWV